MSLTYSLSTVSDASLMRGSHVWFTRSVRSAVDGGERPVTFENSASGRVKGGLKRVWRGEVDDPDGGEYDRPVVVRLTKVMVGSQPEFQETFDVRMHDIRGVGSGRSGAVQVELDILNPMSKPSLKRHPVSSGRRSEN